VTFTALWSAFAATPSQAAVPSDKSVIIVSGSPLSSITTSPPTLTPGFSQSTHDYIVRCQSGVNTINFTFTAASGTIQVEGQSGPTATVQRSLLESQPAVVQATDPSNPSGAPTQYWIRCLPHDFPLITVNKPGNPSPGWYLTSNLLGSSQAAPYAMILDNNGTPVWYAPTPGAAMNVELLPNNTLAWAPLSGPGVGADPNTAYSLYQLDTQTTQLQPTPIRPMDPHELLQLSNGNRMLIATPLKTGVTLPPSFSSANGTVVDCIVQEVDPNGNLVWSWDALNHVAPSENMIATLVNYNGQTAADVYHCNSIDIDPLASNPSSADVLLSVRNDDAVIRINRANTQIPDGKIIWKLGGSPSNQDGAQILSIQSDPETSIYGQHDARFQPSGHVSIYDDHTGHAGAARGMEYNINPTAGTATFVVQFLSPDRMNSGATGSFRRYNNGADNVIGWGFKGGFDMSEFDGSGTDLFDLTMDGNAYRFIKVPLSAIDVNLLRQVIPPPPLGWASWYQLGGGSASGKVALGTNGDGRLEGFIRGTDGAVQHIWQTSPGGGWSSWDSLNGSPAGDPQVATNPDGRLEAFVVGTDGKLYHSWQFAPSSGWTGWYPLEGSFNGRPAIVVNGDGRLEAVVRGTDNAIWHIWQTSPGGGWSQAYSLGGSTTNDATAATNTDGRLEVFARRADQAVWHSWQVAPGSGWSDWYSLGGTVSGTPAVAPNADGRLEVFALGADHALWHSWQTSPNGGWFSFVSFGGSFTADPTIARNADRRLETFVVDGTGQVEHNWQVSPGAGWVPFASLPGFVAGSPPGVGTNADGRLELFGRGTDNTVWHAWQTAPNAGAAALMRPLIGGAPVPPLP
jgi:hypothetical protein